MDALKASFENVEKNPGSSDAGQSKSRPSKPSNTKKAEKKDEEPPQ